MKLIVARFTKEKLELKSSGEDSILLGINKMIKDRYYLMVSDTITVGEFLEKLTKKAKLENEVGDDILLCERYNFYTDYGLVEPNLDIKLMTFLNNFSISHNNVQLSWQVCIGGGGAIEFENIVIRINSEEGCHRNHPHVHIYKNKYTKDGPCVRISLLNMKEMKKGIPLSKLFKRKEIKLINYVLNKYKSDFINYYTQIQLGAMPMEFDVTINGEIHKFK